MPGLFSNIFSHRELASLGVLKTDMHSHFIPGIDDGARTMEDSIFLQQAMMDAGYVKCITTPHIHQEFFPNNKEIIMNGLADVKAEITGKKLPFVIEAAAEYYIDDEFAEKMEESTGFMTFGNNYILIETSVVQKPKAFDKVIFDLILRGYKVVLAHPERYPFLFDHHNTEKVNALKDADVYLQCNIMSFSGLYGEGPKRFAKLMAEEGIVDFLGSDLHNEKQLPFLKEAVKDKSLQKLLSEKEMLNTTL